MDLLYGEISSLACLGLSDYPWPLQASCICGGAAGSIQVAPGERLQSQSSRQISADSPGGDSPACDARDTLTRTCCSAVQAASAYHTSMGGAPVQMGSRTTAWACQAALTGGMCVHAVTKASPEHSRTWLMVQDALIGEHVEVQKLLLARKGKVFRKGIGLVEHTVSEAASG